MSKKREVDTQAQHRDLQDPAANQLRSLVLAKLKSNSTSDTSTRVSPRGFAHVQPVSAVIFSPDGKQLSFGRFDGLIRTWDLKERHLARSPIDNKGPIVALAFSHDMKHAVVASRTDGLTKCDLNTGVWKAFRSMTQVNSEGMSVIASSPNGDLIATASDGRGIVSIWREPGTTVLAAVCKGHTDIVTSIHFSSDGSRVVSGSRDKSVRIWDAETGEPVCSAMTGHQDTIFAVTFSPNGKRVISGSRDKTLRRWDVETGRQVLPPLEGHTSAVSCIDLSPGGSLIISGDSEGSVRLWDARNATTVWATSPQSGSTGGYVFSVAFSPYSTFIASGSKDGNVRLWNVNELLKSSAGLLYLINSEDNWEVPQEASHGEHKPSEDEGDSSWMFNQSANMSPKINEEHDEWPDIERDKSSIVSEYGKDIDLLDLPAGKIPKFRSNSEEEKFSPSQISAAQNGPAQNSGPEPESREDPFRTSRSLITAEPVAAARLDSERIYAADIQYGLAYSGSPEPPKSRCRHLCCFFCCK